MANNLIRSMDIKLNKFGYLVLTIILSSWHLNSNSASISGSNGVTSVTGTSETIYKLGLCLVKAAKAGNRTHVKKLISYNVYVDTPDHNGCTALFWAAHMGHIEIAKLLIESGANVNASCSIGVTILVSAISNKRKIAIVKLLIKSGANVNASSYLGWTPIMEAIFYNSIDIIKLLLENFADVTKINNEGKMPIYYARSSEAIEILEKEDKRVSDLIKERRKNIIILITEKKIPLPLSYIIADYAFSSYEELVDAWKKIYKKEY